VGGLERIRFTTSYPRDITARMIEAVRDVPQICRHIHLPVQSGSNAVLQNMKRTYTREWYADTVKRLKDAVPDMAVSTDIIVGYPGETERDFTDTMSLLEEIEFESAFSFKFSPRPGTPAAACPGDETVDEDTAGRRLSLLQSYQRDITLRKNRERVGYIEEVLAEGISKNDPGFLTGRTSHNRITHFRGGSGLSGKIIKVRITEGLFNSLRGELSV